MCINRVYFWNLNDTFEITNINWQKVILRLWSRDNKEHNTIIVNHGTLWTFTFTAVNLKTDFIALEHSYGLRLNYIHNLGISTSYTETNYLSEEIKTPMI